MKGIFLKKKIVNSLKERFQNIFILYDNDFDAEENHGRLLGAKIAKMYDLKQIEIPTEYQSKDPSDLCHNHNRITLNKVIQQLIII